MFTAEEIIHDLNLQPLPQEGGYYRETYRSEVTLPPEVLPDEYSGERRVSTAIYYLLTPDQVSAMHRVPGEEIFHFYLGDPVEMLQLHPDGRGEVVKIGNDLAAGCRPQVVVPGGTWQGSRLAPGGELALMGTTVAPGFEFDDYQHGDRGKLIAAYPEFAERITELTPDA